MVRSGEDNREPEEKNNAKLLNCQSRNMSSDWEIHDTNYANSLMGSIPTSNHMEVSKKDMIESTSCSNIPLVNSFCPTIWDLPTSSQNLGFADINVELNPRNSHSYGARLSGLHHLGADMERVFGISCTPPNPVFEGGIFVPSVPGMLPQSLAQIPADAGFIERAARFSCFSGGNFGDMMNPFSIHEPVNPYSRSNGLQSMQKNETTMAANSEYTPLCIDHGDSEGSPHKNERKLKSLVKSRGEVKQVGGASVIGSDETGFSGHGGQENPEGTGAEPSSKGLGSKKRKRISQNGEVDESKEVQQAPIGTTKPHTETQPEEDQTAPSAITKIGVKNGKLAPQTSDPPKEEYIHIRARKGQATNSHSLAERVRREKISERMKFLQDLVPGCNKVTGKAVMLDEIINYVQSLQRQVEFLSMKLATVNPRLDFNIESLVAKDMFQSRAGPSSLAFPPDMAMQYRSLHPPPTSLIQSCLPDVGISSDSLQRSISSQFANMVGGYKESTSQVASAWEDELHNVTGMELNSTAPLSTQDHSASQPPAT